MRPTLKTGFLIWLLHSLLSVAVGQNSRFYISLDMGTSLYIGNQDIGLGYEKDRITPMVKLGVGGDITPYVGLKGEIFGYQFKGISDGKGTRRYFHNSPINGLSQITEVPIYLQNAKAVGQLWYTANGHPRYFQDMYYMGASVDVMLHLVNLITKTNFEFPIECSPYIGLHFISSFGTQTAPTTYNFGANGGVITRWNVSRLIDLYVDIRAFAIPENMDGEYSTHIKVGFDAAVSTTIGISFKINEPQKCVNCYN